MSSFNEKRVEYLYEAVKLGTVRAAADHLNISPSAVSRQITLLEEELSVVLLERHRKGVNPTPAGEIVLQHYRNMVSNAEDCLSKLNELQSVQQGHIDVSIGEGFVEEMMLAPLAKFTKQFPNVTISICIEGTNEILRKIETDEAHIGILFHPDNQKGIRSHIIKQLPIRVIVHPGHELIEQEHPVNISQLLDYPIALQEKHFGVRQLLSMVEFQENLCFSPTITTNSIAVLKQFVLSKSGITLLPASVVSQEIKKKTLFEIPIDHTILMSGEAHLITRLGRQLSAGPMKLLQFLSLWMQKGEI